MSDKNIQMQATRDGFGDGLVLAAVKNPQIVGLCADLTDSTKMSGFAERFPDRFVEVGVAEQNLATVASGMAAMGRKPFMASYGAFSPGRNWEQIRTTICLADRNVVIVGAHAGLSVGPDGATHQILEDIALMRSLPNMIVVNPGDANEARAATLALAEQNQPAYIRLARSKSPIFTKPGHDFMLNKAHVLAEGGDVTLTSTGLSTYEAVKARAILAREGISAEVVHVPVIKPLDGETIIASVRKTGRVVTCEEAQINGGFGGAVAELLGENLPVPLRRVGVQDRFGESGTPEELFRELEIDAAAIARKAYDLVKSTS